MSAPRSPQHTVPAHRVGGRYVLRGEIGRGGMAAVYRAVDTVLEREVAVKLPHAHLASDAAFLERFRREARAAAALDHPNVVAVHDWGQTDDGRAFLVLQLVDGPSLRELLRRAGRLDPATAAAFLRPGAEGLGAAHRAGFVHRDVKPENLLLGRDGTVRVTDFGLARAAASATSTFGADVLVGSPHYLAPEAVRGEPLDPRADVYALGVVLFECLTGRPPHEGESPYATAMAHTAREVPPPSEVVADLDPTLDDLVLAATALDRTRRPDTAAEFAAELVTLAPDLAQVDLVGLAGDLAGPPPPPVPSPSATARLPVDHTTTVVPAGVAARDAPDEPSLDEPSPREPSLDEPSPDEPGADGDDDGPEGAPTTVVPAAPARDDRDAGAPDRGRPARRRGRRVLTGVVVVLALLAASAGAGYLLWDRVLAPVSPIPAVAGLPVTEAAQQLEEAGFEVEVADEGVHDLAVPVDHVLAQEPTGEARQGTVVTLVPSAGPRPVEIPEVRGEPAADAEERLTAVGLAPELAERHHDEVPEGRVVATDPPAGEVVDEASAVTVIVSRGPEPVEVPALHGTASDEARTTLREQRLELEIVERRFHEEVPAGAVIEQAPPAGETVLPGDTVEVVVSDGPTPIEVPNVRGDHVDDAVAALEELGFDVDVELRGGFGAFLNPGRVFDQDPGPGSTRHRGDTITVFAYES